MHDAPQVFQGINGPFCGTWCGIETRFTVFYWTEKPAAEYSMPDERVVRGKRVNGISREHP